MWLALFFVLSFSGYDLFFFFFCPYKFFFSSSSSSLARQWSRDVSRVRMQIAQKKKNEFRGGLQIKKKLKKREKRGTVGVLRRCLVEKKK